MERITNASILRFIVAIGLIASTRCTSPVSKDYNYVGKIEVSDTVVYQFNQYNTRHFAMFVGKRLENVFYIQDTLETMFHYDLEIESNRGRLIHLYKSTLDGLEDHMVNFVEVKENTINSNYLALRLSKSKMLYYELFGNDDLECSKDSLRVIVSTNSEVNDESFLIEIPSNYKKGRIDLKNLELNNRELYVTVIRFCESIDSSGKLNVSASVLQNKLYGDIDFIEMERFGYNKIKNFLRYLIEERGIDYKNIDESQFEKIISI